MTTFPESLKNVEYCRKFRGFFSRRRWYVVNPVTQRPYPHIDLTTGRAVVRGYWTRAAAMREAQFLTDNARCMSLPHQYEPQKLRL